MSEAYCERECARVACVRNRVKIPREKRGSMPSISGKYCINWEEPVFKEDDKDVDFFTPEFSEDDEEDLWRLMCALRNSLTKTI